MAEKGQSSVLVNAQVTGPQADTRTLLCDANGVLYVTTTAPAGQAQSKQITLLEDMEAALAQHAAVLEQVRALLVQIEINTRDDD